MLARVLQAEYGQTAGNIFCLCTLLAGSHTSGHLTVCNKLSVILEQGQIAAQPAVPYGEPAVSTHDWSVAAV